jgi:hypothetical protein
METCARREVSDGRRAQIVCALLCVALACAAGSACGKSLSEQRPGGDPDGRLLAALSPVDAALPAGAQIDYVHKLEPLWEACDGMAGTWGWSDVSLDAVFTSSKSVLEVIAHADEVLRRQGWTRETLGQHAGVAGFTSTWTKAIPPAVETVRLSLSNDAPLPGRGPNNKPRVGWALHTSATPPGPPGGGC